MDLMNKNKKLLMGFVSLTGVDLTAGPLAHDQLILPQARFQKQQLTEKENRLLVRFENSQNFLLNRISGPPPATSTSTGSQSSSLSSSSSSWSQKSRYGDT